MAYGIDCAEKCGNCRYGDCDIKQVVVMVAVTLATQETHVKKVSDFSFV